MPDETMIVVVGAAEPVVTAVEFMGPLGDPVDDGVEVVGVESESGRDAGSAVLELLVALDGGLVSLP
jgi:hypothetical protein